jgi:hypothetical protein
MALEGNPERPLLRWLSLCRSPGACLCLPHTPSTCDQGQTCKTLPSDSHHGSYWHFKTKTEAISKQFALLRTCAEQKRSCGLEVTTSHLCPPVPRKEARSMHSRSPGRCLRSVPRPCPCLVLPPSEGLARVPFLESS